MWSSRMSLASSFYRIRYTLIAVTLFILPLTAEANFVASVQSAHSGKCMTVSGASQANGANVEQQDCDGSSHQTINFNLVPGETDIYTLTFAHSSQCADVFGGSIDDGATLIQWPCHGGNNQKFELDALGNDEYALIAQHSGKVAGVEASSTANGADIIQWPWNNTANQKWRIVNTAQTSPAESGEWSNVINWPHIPVSVANLPDGRIMTWASNEITSFPVQDQFTHSTIFNPVTNSFQTTNNPRHDMFCAGTSMLEDGSILAAGGNPQLTHTSRFNPSSSSWEAAPFLNQQRWYSSNLILPSGKVFATFAKGANFEPEIFTPEGGWTNLPGASMANLFNEQNAVNGGAVNNSTTAQWYAYMHVAPDGRVFHPGPTETMHWFDTNGTGGVENAGQRLGGDRHRQFGISIMYDVGKLLVAGGNDIRLNPPSTATAMTIDINGAAPVVTPIADMQFARVFHDAVVLPTGEVLVIGGNTSGVLFSDSGTVLTPELWNPQTGQWRSLANMAIPRNYHSVALLLQDGRVLSGGGGLCGNCAVNHQDAEIFSPPYLFNQDGSQATRPTIVSAPSGALAGDFLTVETTGNIDRFSLVRLSSTTHSINTDQRYLPIDATALGGSQFELAMPDNPNAHSRLLLAVCDQCAGNAIRRSLAARYGWSQRRRLGLLCQ